MTEESLSDLFTIYPYIVTPSSLPCLITGFYLTGEPDTIGVSEQNPFTYESNWYSYPIGRLECITQNEAEHRHIFITNYGLIPNRLLHGYCLTDLFATGIIDILKDEFRWDAYRCFDKEFSVDLFTPAGKVWLQEVYAIDVDKLVF